MQKMLTLASAMLLVSCSKLLHPGVPKDVLDRCVATRNIAGDTPTGAASHRLAEFLAFLQRQGGTARWEADGDTGGVIRMQKVDKLTGGTHTLAFEIALQPGPANGNCAQGLATITRLESDGNVGDAFITESQVIHLVQAMEQASPAPLAAPQSAQDTAAPADPPAPTTEAPAVANDMMTDEEEIENDREYYADQAEKASHRTIAVADQEGSWCCLTVAELIRYFSTGGASYLISPSDDGSVVLDFKDPAGRWNGWTAMSLGLTPQRSNDITGPLDLAEIKIDNKLVASATDQKIAALLRRSFQLHRNNVAQ